MASSFSPQILMLKMVAAINEEPNGWVPGIRTVGHERRYIRYIKLSHTSSSPVGMFHVDCSVISCRVCFLRLVARFKIQAI